MVSHDECSLIFCDGKTVRAEVGSKVFVAELNDLSGTAFGQIVHALWLQLLADGAVSHQPSRLPPM